MATRRAMPGVPGPSWRYRLGSVLGAGAGGVVHDAWDPRLERTVAVKLLSVHAVRRVLQEARAQALLSHPAIVPVYDFGRYETEDGDLAVFIVMERVEGATLRTWLLEPRTEREITDVFVSAAHGLAEAHTHGLVHRDFKPSNVMVTPSGQAKILDFGLARVVADELDEDDPTEPQILVSSEPEPRVTRTGAVLGTPLYMAPEQYNGFDVGPAADQFAFCQAFLEALRGEPLYDAHAYEELAWAKRHRVFAGSRSRSARASGRLQRVLLRGVEPDPRRRWPSMEALIAAIERSGRRRPLLVGGLGLAATVASATAWATLPSDCEDATAEAASIWAEGDRVRVREALAAAAPRGSRFVWSEVEARLDARVQQWVGATTQLCRGREALSSSVVDRRAACLRDVASTMRATVRTLSDADASVAEHAVEAVDAIPDPVRCNLASSDAGGPPRPPLPVQAARVEAVRAAIKQSSLQMRAGKFDEARIALVAAEVEGDAIDFEPLRLELGLASLELDVAQGRLDGAEEGLTRLLEDADALHYAELAARAAIALARLVAVELERNDDAVRHLRRAEALVERMGNPELLRVEVLDVHAEIALAETRFDDAERLRTQQLALLDAVGGQELRAAEVLVQHGLGLAAAGRFPEARKTILRAMGIQERLLGPLHPRTGHGLHALANVHLRSEDFTVALAAIEQALAIYEEAYGDRHPAVARALISLAELDMVEERFEPATAKYERALAILVETYGQDHSDVAHARARYGRVLHRSGDLPRAEAELRRALEIHERTSGPRSPSAARVLLQLGALDRTAKRFELARTRYERGLQFLRERLGSKHPSVASALIALGHLENHQPFYDGAKAEAHYRESLQIHLELSGPGSVGAVRATYGLGRALTEQGRLGPARAAMAKVIAGTDALGDPVGMGLYARMRLANLQWDAGERTAALDLMQEAAALARKHKAPSHQVEEFDAWVRRHGNLRE